MGKPDSKGNDARRDGQNDRKESRKDTFADIIGHGGQSPEYHPPKDKGSRTQYNDGWKNPDKK